jgi:hypothetical protein
MDAEHRLAERLALIDTSLELGEMSAEQLADSCRVIRRVGMSWMAEADLNPIFVRESELPETWSASRRSHYVWNAGLFAEIAGDDFEDILLTGLGKPSFSFNYVRKKADRLRADRKRAERRLRGFSTEGVELYEASIFDVEELRLGPASLVLTDPPYEASAVDLWVELGRFASRVLVPGGWLVAMSGQKWLPEIFQALGDSGLYYCWTMAVTVTGVNNQQGWVSRRNPVNNRFKPILVYSNGEPSAWPDGLSDLLASPARDKNHHEWGQSVEPFKQLVEFAPPGGLVVDPFLGGGTTAEAARGIEHQRPIEGFDLDPQHVTTAAERLERVEAQAVLA